MILGDADSFTLLCFFVLLHFVVLKETNHGNSTILQVSKANWLRPHLAPSTPGAYK